MKQFKTFNLKIFFDFLYKEEFTRFSEIVFLKATNTKFKLKILNSMKSYNTIGWKL